MNASQARLPSLFRFWRFHEQLNRTFKLCVCSIAFADKAAAEQDPAVFFPRFISDSGEPWGTAQRWPHWKEENGHSVRFLSEMAVARVDSAFDHYLSQIEAEYSRHCGDIPQVEMQSSMRAEKVAKRLGLSLDGMDSYIMVLSLFGLIRNCIIHRDGEMTEGVLVMLRSASLAETYAQWPTRRAAPKPSVPLVAHGRLQLRPRDVIVFADACLKLAQHCNAELCRRLSVEDLVWEAAYQALLSESPQAALDPCASLPALLKDTLNRVLNVQELTDSAVVKALRAKERWQPCLAHYARFKR